MIRSLNSVKENTKWMFRFVRPHKRLWTLAIIFDIVGDALGTYFIACGLEKMSEGMLQGEWNIIMNGIVYVALCFITRLVFYSLFHLTHGISTARIRSGLRGAIFYKLVKLPMKNDEEKQVSENLTYLNQDVDLTMSLFTQDYRLILKAIVISVVVLGGIFSRNVMIGIICFFVFLFNILGNIYFIPKQGKTVKERQKALAKINGVYHDTFAGAMVIKTLGLKSMMTKRINDAANDVNEIKKKERKLTLIQNSCTKLFLYIISMLPIIFGAYLFVTNRMVFGSIFFIKEMVNNYLWHCNQLGTSVMNLSKSRAGAERLYALLNQSDEIDQFGYDTILEQKNCVLKLNHLDISYGDKRIVKQLCMQLNNKETTAIIGSSGSGKSSIMKAIMQFTTFEGSMQLYGKEAKEYSLTTLRETFAYVEQEARMFDGTVYDNILFGKLEATADEVYEAATKAYAHEFILNLPNGYDTIIGENGYKLSGGERQRLAIARAFLKDAPVLLLDEATSALDSVSEKKVQMAIDELMKGRTILVVAHRLSTIKNADRIIVLEHGEIIESGKHQELLERDGRYKQLYQLQFCK